MLLLQALQLQGMLDAFLCNRLLQKSRMPTSASDMDTEVKNSATNTTTVTGSWLTIDVSSLQTPESILPFLLLGLFLPKIIDYMRRRRKVKPISVVG